MDIGITSLLRSRQQSGQTLDQGSPALAKESGSVDAATPAVVEQRPAASSQPVEGAVAQIQNYVQTIRRDLSFSLDDSSGTMIVKVTHSESGEVIRQLPSEEALRLAERLEEVRSLLFEAEA